MKIYVLLAFSQKKKKRGREFNREINNSIIRVTVILFKILLKKRNTSTIVVDECFKVLRCLSCFSEGCFPCSYQNSWKNFYMQFPQKNLHI